MLTLGDIRWGSYKTFEGPWTLGEHPYTLPDNATQSEKVMAVITATEGGRYDAVNMYDVCLWTAGIIQWCNRAPQRSVDSMLSRIAEADARILTPLTKLAQERGYQYARRSNQWQFLSPDYGELSTPERQRQLYFAGSSGEVGAWTEEQKHWARRWCLATAQVLGHPEAKRLQVMFTVPRLHSYFAHKSGAELLRRRPETPVGYAWEALYLSYAANNPLKASQAVENALRDSAGVMEPWTVSWLANMAWHMIFDPGIAIYPHRYEKVRPVIERLWGVDLPDAAGETEKWAARNHLDSRWLDPVELQRALVALGYDIGPSGADGVMGQKTREALMLFERRNNVPESHRDGMPDRHTLHALEAALERRGTEKLS